MSDTGQRLIRLPPELQLTILRYMYEPDHPYLVYQRNYAPNAEPFWSLREQAEPLWTLREQLKPIRLISRVFHDAVTPTIFASIHLHASELSLQRAESIANSSLAHYVRELVHHEGTFAGSSQDKSSFLTILKSHRRRQDYPKSYSFSADDDELYTNYLQEVEAAYVCQSFETGRMAALLQKLSRCVTFVTLPYNRGWCDPETSAYTLRRTGLSYLPKAKDPDRATLSFLSAMTQWQPRVLNLAKFSPDSHFELLWMLQQQPHPDEPSPRFINWAKNLDYLRLSWPETGDWVRQTVEMSDYPLLLRHLFLSIRNLTHLELTNGFDFALYIPTEVVPECGLPKLSRLTISKGTPDRLWIESQVYYIIKRLAPTLKFVHFDQITLYAYPSSSVPHHTIAVQEQKGSLLRLLYNLTPHMYLESFTGLESVVDAKSDRRLQDHVVFPGPKPGKATILEKAQDAVCGKRSWPDSFNMDHLSMHHGVAQLDNATMNTPEAAFVINPWEETVDPWDTERVLELAPDHEQDTQQAGSSSQPSGSNTDGAPPVTESGNQSELSTQNAASSSLPKRSKRSKLSKLLGLK